MGSGDPTSLPWPIRKLNCDLSVETKTKMADTTIVTKHFKTNAFLSPAAPKARDGRYCICPSIRLSVRHV